MLLTNLCLSFFDIILMLFSMVCLSYYDIILMLLTKLCLSYYDIILMLLRMVWLSYYDIYNINVIKTSVFELLWYIINLIKIGVFVLLWYNINMILCWFEVGWIDHEVWSSIWVEDSTSPHADHGGSCFWLVLYIQWFGLRENLQETIDFPLNMRFSCKLSLKPIHWYMIPNY